MINERESTRTPRPVAHPNGKSMEDQLKQSIEFLEHMVAWWADSDWAKALLGELKRLREENERLQLEVAKLEDEKKYAMQENQ